jgi:predicted transcriptional regulator
MFLTVKQKILVTLLDHGPLQNSDIAKRVGITEQCSQTVNALHREGLIKSEFISPRRINSLTKKGVEIAKRLKEISENVLSERELSLR